MDGRIAAMMQRRSTIAFLMTLPLIVLILVLVAYPAGYDQRPTLAAYTANSGFQRVASVRFFWLFQFYFLDDGHRFFGSDFRGWSAGAERRNRSGFLAALTLKLTFEQLKRDEPICLDESAHGIHGGPECYRPNNVAHNKIVAFSVQEGPSHHLLQRIECSTGCGCPHEFSSSRCRITHLEKEQIFCSRCQFDVWDLRLGH